MVLLKDRCDITFRVAIFTWWVIKVVTWPVSNHTEYPHSNIKFNKNNKKQHCIIPPIVLSIKRSLHIWFPVQYLYLFIQKYWWVRESAFQICSLLLDFTSFFQGIWHFWAVIFSDRDHAVERMWQEYISGLLVTAYTSPQLDWQGFLHSLWEL